MKKFVFVFGIVAFSYFGYAQNLKMHTVQAGESVKTIASFYKITVADIYALNPDAKSDFSVDMVLIIPEAFLHQSNSTSTTKELVSYKVHRVRRKETLFSIAQKYDLTVEDIKAHNKELYSKNLRSGNKIYIPKFKLIPKPSVNIIQKYTVLAKEGKWRIAYKFGISVPELEALNPNMGLYPQAGEILNVPNIAESEEKTIQDKQFSYYTVKAKEGFYRLEKKLGLTKVQLEALNPELVSTRIEIGYGFKDSKDECSKYCF